MADETYGQDDMQLNTDNRRRKRAMLRRVHKRSAVAFSVIFILMMILIIRIAMINYTKGDEYSKIVLNHQSYTSTTIAARRGEILDRNGTVLAYSEKVYNLIIDPKMIRSSDDYLNPTLDALVQYFALSKSDLQDILNTKPDSRYVKVLSNLTSDQIAAFQALLDDKENNADIKGVWFEDAYVRDYPFSTLACDAIGFASTANGGELGLEKYYDDELTGTDGMEYNYVDDSLDTQETVKSAQDGDNIVTTLDYGAQSIVEKYIKKYNEEKPSSNTACIIVNPSNGEILTMASYPTFDLNNPRDLSGIYTQDQLAGMSNTDVTNALFSTWSNFCVSQAYEPGSTFKPITVASALEEGVVSDSDHFFCGGYLEVGGYTISCWKRSDGGHGDLSLSQALGQSCNVALMEIGARLGGVKMGMYQELFGFGSKTGIDLPSEERGLVKDGSKMDATDVATNSFGQNISVNMVQMVAAYSSLLNGGSYYKPHMVKAIENSSGAVIKNISSTLVRQTVTEETSQLIRTYLRKAVDEEAVNGIAIDGYSIGGKTGTAQKIPRSDKKWVISCMAFAPAENPQFLAYLVIDEPDGTTGRDDVNAGEAQSLMHDMLTELLPYLGVYKDSTATTTTTTTTSEGAVSVPSSTTPDAVISDPDGDTDTSDATSTTQETTGATQTTTAAQTTAAGQ